MNHNDQQYKDILELLQEEIAEANRDTQIRFDILSKKLDKIKDQYFSAENAKSTVDRPEPAVPSECNEESFNINSVLAACRKSVANENSKREETVYQEEQRDGLLRTVKMEATSSLEFYKYPDGSIKQVLQDISIETHEGQIWGFIGNQTFEIKLLLEIMANVKPYSSGRCILMERGMMRKKRKIVPHIFYFGSTEMLFYNMNVLEYLMFVTSKTGINPVDRQERILNLLIEMGLGYLTLVPINNLTEQEQAAILLSTSIFSESSKLIFLNLPDIHFNEITRHAINVVASYIKESRKTLILSTQDFDLVDKICTHTAVLINGGLVFSGCRRRLYNELDKLAFIIKTDNAKSVAQKLRDELPDYYFELIDNDIYVYNYSDKELNTKLIAAVLIKLDIEPQMLIKSSKSTRNAFREAIKRYDHSGKTPK